MGNVFAFNTTEMSAIDTDPIQTLKRELGEKRCRSLVDGMIFEITDILCRIEKQIGQDNSDGIVELLDLLFELTGKIGLVCLTDVIVDLKECIDAGDIVAVNAVAARLIRLGEDSLFSLIEFTDRSIV